MSHFIYILYSIQADHYYIGSSSNPDERLKKHLSNHKGFTARVKDWKLVYREDCFTKSLALIREKEIKSWKSRKKIEELIRKYAAG